MRDRKRVLPGSAAFFRKATPVRQINSSAPTQVVAAIAAIIQAEGVPDLSQTGIFISRASVGLFTDAVVWNKSQGCLLVRLMGCRL
jgi:hypothetical protein